MSWAQPEASGPDDIVQAWRVLVAGAPVMQAALDDVAEHGSTPEVRREARQAGARMVRLTAQPAQDRRTARGRPKGPGTG